ncbi:hypothetical protein D3C80_1277950 [compost metagenome]
MPFVDHTQEVDNLNGVRFFVFQCGVFFLEFGELLGMGAALENHDALAHQILGIGGARLAVAIDDLRGDLQVGMGKTRLGLAFFAADQAGGGQYRT